MAPKAVDGQVEKDGSTDGAKNHVPSEEEKKLLQLRKTARMLFTKKINLIRDRANKGDDVSSLKLLAEKVEKQFELLEKSCLNLVDFYTSNEFDDDFIDKVLDYCNECESQKWEVLSHFNSEADHFL